MINFFSSENAVRNGWLSGWAFIAFFVLAFSVGFIAGVSQTELDMTYFNPLQTALYYTLFIVFLLGIRGFALSLRDEVMIKNANSFLVVNILLVLLLWPTGAIPQYLDKNFLLLLFVAALPLVCVNGIILLRLSEDLQRYVDVFGTVARRAAWWNKLAGWMLASVVLCIPGFVASLIGEFFLWRLLAKDLNLKGNKKM